MKAEDVTMQFEQLIYAVTIAEQRNITYAANRLYLSQSALTKSMNRLEEELGVKLFNRSASPIQLTAAGEYFITEAKKILSLKEKMEEGMKSFSEPHTGTIRVGMGPGRGEYWSPFILSRYHNLYPEVEVEIIGESMLDLENKLLNNELDICIVGVSGEQDPRLSYEMICQERMLFTIPRGHACLSGYTVPRDSFDTPLMIHPDTLQGQTFITSKPGYAVTKQLEDILERNHIIPGAVKHAMSIDAAYIMSTEGMGISYVYDTCKFQSGYFNKPVFCVLEEDEEVCSFMTAVRASEEPSPLVSAFIHAVKDSVRMLKTTQEM